jgi:hypothetical protein
MDPIGDALAIALDEMEQYSTDERYSDPEVSIRIAAVRAFMEELQLFLDSRVH